MAKIFQIPVVYICENNLFGLGTFCARAAANTKYYTRCEYIPGICIDGMDVLAVREGIKFAIDYAQSGNGPIIAECVTYRYFGHSMSDPGTSYRKREDIEETREKETASKSTRII
ncbi:hypothetical protein WA026_014545 [Henosepilachna vigintioctopunctata]|uniref:Dehydrogenase E1 component domain-containing protein n=1 Tax=Henosepilachna vigintioctopunctata TaxID=420089 RepID=A0AAW1UEV9_9CUCU